MHTWFKNYAPFTNCISEINDTREDDAHDIDVVKPMHNLMKCSDIYSKTSGSFSWQYCIDVPVLDNNDYYWFSY